MNNVSKSKIVTWLVVLLIIANAATITMFWLRRAKILPRRNVMPREFLEKELNFDSMQQSTFELLRKEHRDTAEQLRNKIAAAKDFFSFAQTNYRNRYCETGCCKRNQ